MKTETFEAHPAWTTLAELKTKTDRLLDADTPEQRYWVRRLNSILEYVDTLRASDPILVEDQGITEIQSHLTQLNNHIDNYLADQEVNLPHLQAASDYVPQVMATVRSQFPFMTADQATPAIKASATRYKNSLDAEVDALRERVGEMAEQADAKNTESITEFEDLRARIEAARQEVSSLSVTLNSQIDQQRTAFEADNALRSSTFEEAQKVRSDQFASDRGESQKAQEEQFERQRSSGEDFLNKLEAYEQRAGSLVDTTSKHAISGDYKTWAALQGKAANAWTKATVVLGILVAVGLGALAMTASGDSTGFIMSKLSISVVGLIVAGYSARQASEYRKEERTSKRLALDLDALEPFLEHVDDAKALRTEVAKRIFAPTAPANANAGAGFRFRRNSLSIGEIFEIFKSMQK